MSWGSNWQRIRIGIRGSYADPGYQGSVVCPVALGVFSSSGVGGGFLADRSQAYFGVTTGSTFPGVHTFQATGSNHWLYWGGFAVTRRVDTAVTNTNSATTNMFFSATPATVRSGMFLDISRAAGTWTITLTAPSTSANALIDKGWMQWTDDLSNTTGTVTGYTTVSLSYANPGSPFNDKIFDTVSIANYSSLFRFILQDVSIIRIQ